MGEKEGESMKNPKKRLELRTVKTLLYSQGYMVLHPSQATAEHHNYCTVEEYRYHVPLALYILLSLSNVLIILNSSLNFVIYCLVEETFRTEACNFFSDGWKRARRMVGL